MTAANEYSPAGAEGEEAAASGGLFGLQLTPPVLGAIIAVVGLLLAGYLATQVVMPVNEENGKLTEDIKTKNDQINNQQKQLQRKAEAEAKLAAAEQRRGFVTTMFASDSSIETLLLDVNQLVDKLNAGIGSDERKAKLTKFEPVLPPAGAAKPGVPQSDPDILNDTSLGPALAGQLRRKAFKVEFEGNYTQTRSFLQNLERMQSLLLVRNLKTQLVEQSQKIEIELRQGKIVPVASVQPKLKTSFDLYALLPLKLPEKPKVAAPASPAK